MDTLERNYADLECQRKRDLQSIQDELKQANTLCTKLQKERDDAQQREDSAQVKMRDQIKLLADKSSQYDSLNKDF